MSMQESSEYQSKLQKRARKFPSSSALANLEKIICAAFWLRRPPDLPAVGLFSIVPCRYCHHTTPPGHWQPDARMTIRRMKELDVQSVF